jgi:NADPH-dependent curcumin reductase CurA
MSIPKSTKVYIVNESPTGAITPSTFRLETQPLPSESELKGGQLLVRTIAMSNDPAQRQWITKGNDPVRAVLE